MLFEVELKMEVKRKEFLLKKSEGWWSLLSVSLFLANVIFVDFEHFVFLKQADQAKLLEIKSTNSFVMQLLLNLK